MAPCRSAPLAARAVRSLWGLFICYGRACAGLFSPYNLLWVNIPTVQSRTTDELPVVSRSIHYHLSSEEYRVLCYSPSVYLLHTYGSKLLRIWSTVEFSSLIPGTE